MPAKLIDFGATTYPTVDKQFLNEAMASRAQDCYLTELKHWDKRPGNTLFSTLGAGNAAIDGMYRTKSIVPGTILAVANGVVYKVSSGGVGTAFTGTAMAVGTPVVFTEDKTNVFAANGGRIFRLDLTLNTQTQLTGGNAPSGVTFVAFLNNFLIANGTNGSPGDVFFSDDVANNYEAPASWEFYNNEAIRDSCNAVTVQWEEVYGFGPDSLEISYDDGETPFAKLQGAFVPYGLAAPYSLLNLDNTLYYLSSIDGALRLVKLEGRRPILVSEPEDKNLQGFSSYATAKAFAMTDGNGKSVYCLSFGSPDNVTLAFNLRTRVFSRLGLWNGATYDAFIGQNSVYSPEFGKFLVGDRRLNGKIYSVGGFTDNGSVIRMELTSNVHQWGTYHKKKTHRLIVQGSANVPWKFQYAEKALALPGSLVSYTMRADGFTFINRLGRYKSRIYQIVHDDTVTDFVLIDAEEWFEVLNH